MTYYRKGFHDGAKTAREKLKWVAIVFALALLLRLGLATQNNFEGDYVTGERSWEYCHFTNTVPHDMGYYKCWGERVRDGEPLYTGFSSFLDKNPYEGKGIVPYTYAYPLVMAYTLDYIGTDFLHLKLPAIIFDMATMALVYLIGRRLFNHRHGLVAATIYGLMNYIGILSSGLFGNDDHAYTFLVTLAVYLLMRGSVYLLPAAIIFGVAVWFKLSAVFFVLPMMYYIWRKYTPWKMLVFLACAVIVANALIIPFYQQYGRVVFLAWNPRDALFIDGLNLLNFARLSYGLPYDLAHSINYADQRMDDPLNYWGNHWFMNLLKMMVLPLQIFGFASCLVIIVVLDKRWVSRILYDITFVKLLFVLPIVLWIFGQLYFDLYFVAVMPWFAILLAHNIRRDWGYLAGATLVFFAYELLPLWNHAGNEFVRRLGFYGMTWLLVVAWLYVAYRLVRWASE